jgi:hypothetical protein
MKPLLLCVFFVTVLPLRAEQPKRRTNSKPERHQQNLQQHQESDQNRIDRDIAPVKAQMQRIQQSSIRSDRKIEMQRTLIDRKITKVKEQMREIQASASKDPSPSGRDRRKAGLDNLQKTLDILRGMNPQI